MSAAGAGGGPGAAYCHPAARSAGPGRPGRLVASAALPRRPCPPPGGRALHLRLALQATGLRGPLCARPPAIRALLRPARRYHGEPLAEPMAQLAVNALQYYLSQGEVEKEWSESY